MTAKREYDVDPPRKRTPKYHDEETLDVIRLLILLDRPAPKGLDKMTREQKKTLAAQLRTELRNKAN